MYLISLQDCMLYLLLPKFKRRKIGIVLKYDADDPES